MSGPHARSTTARTATRLRRWLSVRHSLRAEALVVLVLWGLYEGARGLIAGNGGDAVQHAHQLVALEQWLHVFAEERLQHSADTVPGLTGLLGLCYLTLHLGVTGGVLLWLHQRRPAAFALVRTSLLLASGLALVAFLAFPAAPPRLAAIGISDTVSGDHINLNTGLVSSLYNPYAALPSMHIAYAIVVAACLFRHCRSWVVRVLAALYPPFVLLVVVVTGNHFFVDAVIGGVVAGLGAAMAGQFISPMAATRLTPVSEREPALEKLAA